MQKKILTFIIIAVIAGVFAWSPWITSAAASKLAETQFNNAWNGVMDGCGTYGNNLGVKEFRKIPFGAFVTLDYQCGLVMPDEIVHHSTVFVSFFGTGFGYPKP
jgi:hypothetical protein